MVFSASVDVTETSDNFVGMSGDDVEVEVDVKSMEISDDSVVDVESNVSFFAVEYSVEADEMNDSSENPSELDIAVETSPVDKVTSLVTD